MHYNSQLYKNFFSSHGVAYLFMDEEDFAEALAASGFSERSIEQEIKLLNEYRSKFNTEVPDEYKEDIGEEALRNVISRRKRKDKQKESIEDEE